ncbi:MAG: YqjF family protein [Pyrinomonadaceae bacterium]
MSKFLTAKWVDLIMANYAVSPDLVADLIPKGTEPDIFEGTFYISLVSFKFRDTAVLGVPVPFHKDFEEINLRFYVKRTLDEEIRRGVVFVKEIVPKSAVTWVARKLYGEPYETWTTWSEEDEDELTYFWERGETENRIHVEIAENLGIPKSGSVEEFITEHYWGYTRRGELRTDEYRVSHPKWEVYNVNYAEIEVDFGATYGERFSVLNETAPNSIFLAKGSDIVVYKGEHLRRK